MIGTPLDPEALAEEIVSRPPVLLIHGGGGYTGRRSDLRAWQGFYARNGIVTLSIDYTLTGEGGAPTYPRPEQNAKAAVQYLRLHEAELGTDRVVVQGHSAGARLGAILLTTPDDPSFVYDEMAYFGENCAEHGLPIGDVVVERVSHQLDDRRQISGLRWGVGEPRLVLLHGGAQNAHTWDTVALALRPTPLLAVDLPGHGARLDEESTLANRRQAIVDVLQPGDVLVGHSGGGFDATLAAELKELDVFPTPDEAPDFYVDYGETGPYVAETGDSECAT